MKILAFLQNPWFMPGTNPRHIDMYRRNQNFHRKVLLMSATGQALHRAFGPKLYGKIIWENANWRHGSERRAKMPADVAHMINVLVTHGPDLIICFGHEAKIGMKAVACGSAEVLFAPHPMAHGSAADHLRVIIQMVRRRL